MPVRAIPRVDLALIGGSATLGCRFPEDADVPGVEVIERDIVFETPYGEITKFKLVNIAGAHTVDGHDRLLLTNRMHGWRKGESRSRGSEQLFWVLNRAKVKWVISNAGVGSVNPLLDTRDFVAATDFIDLTTHRRTLMFPGNLIIMRQPICPNLHSLLVASAIDEGWPRVIRRGVMAVTEGPRFETRAEVSHLRQMGADMVAQSMVPEVNFSREIGACYAAAFLISNYAEGVVQDWEHKELKAIYHDLAVSMSKTLLRAASKISPVSCGCRGTSERLLYYSGMRKRLASSSSPVAGIPHIDLAVLDCISGPDDAVDDLLQGICEVRISPPADLGSGFEPPVVVREIDGAWAGKKIRALWVSLGANCRGSIRALRAAEAIEALADLGIRNLIAGYEMTAVNSALDPGDAVVPSDLLDQTRCLPVDLISRINEFRLPLLSPACRHSLTAGARAQPGTKVFCRGVAAAIDSNIQETTSATRASLQCGADVICKGLVPEIYVSANNQMQFAALGLITGYAAGIGWESDWTRLQSLTRAETTRRLLSALVTALAQEFDTN